MNVDEEIARILSEHKGEKIGPATVRPLTVEDQLDPQVLADQRTIGGAILALAGKAGAAGSGEALAEALLDAASPALPALRRILARCCDAPLKELPAGLLPLLLAAVIRQNFSLPQLALWAGLLRELRAGPGGPEPGGAGSTTSATPGSSCSTTATDPPGNSRPGSSSSGSGAACGASGGGTAS